MSTTTKDKLAQRFADDAARRHAAGLPLKQAEFIALRQLVADARNGVVDRGQVRAFIIKEEMALGRSAGEAREHADLVLAGKPSAWAERDYGIEKRRKRRPGGNHHSMSGPGEAEDITKRFFSQNS